MQAEFQGKIQTVLGPIDPDSLGVTLPHEHFLHDSTCCFIEPTDQNEKVLAYQPVCLENLNWVIYHNYSNLDNFRFDDEQLVIKELTPFKQAGGNTIVEQSVRGIHGNPASLVRISRATGINVIMATGYYIASTHPSTLTSMTEEQIADELAKDITEGIYKTGVHAGMLKGACGAYQSDGIEETERKVMRACVLAQQRTGAPIGIHNMRVDFAAEVLDILADAGADLSRVVMYHADRWGSDPPIYHKLLQAGCYLEFDGFGTDERGVAPIAACRTYRINDTQRCTTIARLIAEGYLKHILISQDVWTKNRHVSFGGVGYEHILLHTAPLMRHIGISDEQIHTIMVENPKRLLTFVPQLSN